MNVDELNLPAPVKARLVEAGLDTVTAVLEAGTDGLTAIDGIGPKTASDVLKAVQAATLDGNGDAGHESGVQVGNDPQAQQASSAPDGNQRAASKVTAPAAEADPNQWVTVRNVADAMLLVGERYLLPGQTRTVRRHLIRHVPAKKLEIR